MARNTKGIEVYKRFESPPLYSVQRLLSQGQRGLVGDGILSGLGLRLVGGA